MLRAQAFFGGTVLSPCVLRRHHPERKVVVCPKPHPYTALRAHSVVSWLQKTYTFAHWRRKRRVSESQEPLQTRQLGELLFFKKKEQREVCIQRNWRTKNRTASTTFWKCGKKLGVLPEPQGRSGQMTIERGSLVIQADTQLRIVEQTRRGNCTGQR